MHVHTVSSTLSCSGPGKTLVTVIYIWLGTSGILRLEVILQYGKTRSVRLKVISVDIVFVAARQKLLRPKTVFTIQVGREASSSWLATGTRLNQAHSVDLIVEGRSL